uniref:Uncharacterized protein n=1 Tax=Moniliophthora roreri TaxID=221103 RepID=A0A0W0ETR1_MONRR
MSIAQLEEIVSEILSLIRIDGCYHVEFDLLDVLPDMQGVRDDLERLIEGLSFLKQETYEHEPKDTRLWAWLVFRQRQIRTIDKLYWSLRLVHMKILVAIEKEKRRLRLGTGRNQNPNQGTSPYESLAPSKSMLRYLPKSYQFDAWDPRFVGWHDLSTQIYPRIRIVVTCLRLALKLTHEIHYKDI